MAGDIVRPSELVTTRTSPAASEYLVVDNGSSVAKARIDKVVQAGRPVASQAEAVAGTNNTKIMTPLTTQQAIDANLLSPEERADIFDARDQTLASAADAASDAGSASASAGSASGSAATAATSAGQAMTFRNEAQTQADRSEDEADRSEVAADRSEEARDIAAGYASDAVSQGNVPIYATRAGLSELSVPVGMAAIRLNGITGSDDAKGGIYAYRVSEPVHSGKAQDSTGKWFERVTADLPYDTYRSSVLFFPESYYDETGDFPVGSGAHLTVAISPGGRSSGVLNRVTGLGALQFQKAVNIDRSEAIGVNSMQYTAYANRVTAIGANAGQWLGSTDPIADGHPMYTNSGGLPGQPGWDYDGLETRNPGIGAKLAAITVTSDLDAYQTVIIGRDSLGGIRARYSVSVGYHSLSAGSDVEGVTSVGVETFHDGVLLKYSSGFGYGAGKLWQEGERNLLAGNDAGRSAIKGSNNTLVGPFAGSDATELNDTVFLGSGAGNSFGAVPVTGVLSISNRTKADLISGSFVNENVGIGGIRGDLAAGILHVVRAGIRAAGAPTSYSVGNRTLIVENNGAVGITMQGVASSTAILAAFSTALKGFLKYDFTNDNWEIGSNNVTRLRVTPTGMGFNGAAAVAKPTGVAVTAAAIHAALVSYGLIAA